MVANKKVLLTLIAGFFIGAVSAIGLAASSVDLVLAFQAFAPRTNSWEAKKAYAKCEKAIAGSIPWPSQPKLACRAMHMCANEAILTDKQNATLTATIQSLPDCATP